MENCYLCIHRNIISQLSLSLKTSGSHTPKFFRMPFLFVFLSNDIVLWNVHVLWCSYLYSYPDEQMEKWSVPFSVVIVSVVIIIQFTVSGSNYSLKKKIIVFWCVRLYFEQQNHTWLHAYDGLCCIVVNSIFLLCMQYPLSKIQYLL